MSNATRELLEQHFDTAFAAPDGIKKLRELILSLAMQGKLVPQDHNDPPVSELLKHIDAEKKRLVKEGRMKAPKPLLDIKEDEIPYVLPLGWQWVRLGDITEIIRGITFPASEKTKIPAIGKIACLRTANVQKEIEWDDLLHIDEDYVRKESQIICKHDIVMSMANSRELVGKVAIIREEPSSKATFGGFLGVIRTFEVVPLFILNLLTADYARTSLIDSASQTTNIANVSLGKLNPFLVPIPPLPEQHRIVAKIDQLMARCDELERLRAEREQKRRSVHAAALKQLLDAQAPDSIADAWQFISRHFGDLYAVKENVAELRKAVLQLAVTGKLVPQNPNDPPASQLLKEIEAEKRRLVKEGKIKAPKPLPAIKPEEVPYLLPQGWEWVRLVEICDYNGRANIEPEFVAANTWLLDLEDIEKNTSRLLYRAKYSERQSKSTKSTFQKGDVLYGKLRPYLDKVLVADADGVCTTEIVPIVPSISINSEFLRWLLKRPAFLEHVNSLMYGVKMPRLGTEDAVQSIHPLPPLSEQHRIVAKIDQLMSLCDTLEQQIDAATGKQTELLDALMARM